MKKFFIQITILTLVLLSIIGGINYYKDPALILHRGILETEAAFNITQGYSVDVTSNINDRLLQRYVIQHMKNIPDGIFLGNSQIGTACPSSLGYDNPYNHSVVQGDIYDFIGILNEYKTWHKEYPKEVVFTMDPWMFNENNKILRHMEFDIPIDKKTFPIAELFSLSYFKTSLFVKKSFSFRLNHIKVFKKLEDAKTYSGSVIFPNGTFKLEDGYETYWGDIVPQLNQLIETDTIFGFENFHELSPRIQTDFENIVNELQKHNVNVVFMFIPRPPTLWNYIQNDSKYDMFNVGETYLRQLALEKNIDILGSYNPSVVGAKDTDYYDPYHGKAEFMDRLIKGFVK